MNPEPSREWRQKWLGLDESHPDVFGMTVAVERWAKRCVMNDVHPKMLVLIGANGVGKSTVARRAMIFVTQASVEVWHLGKWPVPPRARSFPWHVLSMTSPLDRNGETVWREATESNVLMLDDVGAEVDRFKNELPQENLRLLLEEMRDRWLLITTNVPPEAWASIWDDRVADRLYRHSEIVFLKRAHSYLRSQRATS